MQPCGQGYEKEAINLYRRGDSGGFTVSRAETFRRTGRLGNVRRRWAPIRQKLGLLKSRTPGSEFERLREFLGRPEEQRLLGQVRGSESVCWPRSADSPEPLVTVRIATYRRSDLIKRALDSVLSQSYQKLEVMVIGDACDDATQKAVESYSDMRLRFINLPTRGLYPEDAKSRWMVAGTHPMNAALPLISGDWIAPCDDDDEFTPNHVEALLERAISGRYEMVWSRAMLRQPDGNWVKTEGPPMALNRISHGSVLYSSGLRFFQHSNTSWRMKEPGDWNLWRRMQKAGVRIGFLDEVTYYHY